MAHRILQYQVSSVVTTASEYITRGPLTLTNRHRISNVDVSEVKLIE